MHLVQLFLPVQRGGTEVPGSLREVEAELTERFGGVTSYARAAAEGLWKDDAGTAERDSIVIVETMVPIWDPEWWRSYRARLERRLGEKELLIRAFRVERV